MRRRLGRGDREALRLALRTAALAPLAQNEVRGDAGVGGRRFHGTAGIPRWPRRPPRWLLRRRGFLLRGTSRHRLHDEAAPRSARQARRFGGAAVPVYEGDKLPSRRSLGAAGGR